MLRGETSSFWENTDGDSTTLVGATHLIERKYSKHSEWRERRCEISPERPFIVLNLIYPFLPKGVVGATGFSKEIYLDDAPVEQ